MLRDLPWNASLSTSMLSFNYFIIYLSLVLLQTFGALLFPFFQNYCMHSEILEVTFYAVVD